MSDKPYTEIDDLLREDRTFPPPAEFRARAVVRDESLYAEAERDPDAFWAKFAAELEWSRPWDKVLEQRIHSFHHPRIGNFEIFIVPVISRDTSGAHYECIFNRPLVKHTTAT